MAKEFFNCFGCKRSGNVLDFVNHKVFQGKDLKAAARWLIALATPAADRAAGSEITPAEDAEGAAGELSERDRAICRAVARYLAMVFAPFGSIETIAHELSRLVGEEVGEL